MPKNSLTHNQPINRAATLDSQWYIDAHNHPVDLESLIYPSWQMVAHIDEIKDPGDILPIKIGDYPLLVVRGPDHEITILHNVCRHRGGPLAKSKGNSRALRCHYHGWTYGLDGTLTGTPEFEQVENFDKSKFCLPIVAHKIWQGLIFICLSPKPPSFDDMTAAIAERTGHMDFAELQFYRQAEYEIACNWKVYMDNYQEGYHLPYVHPGLSRLLDYSQYTTQTHEGFTIQSSPIDDSENYYGGGSGTAFYVTLFPNIMLNILPGRLQTNLVLPISADRCKVIFKYYYHEIAAPEAIARIESEIVFSDTIQREDIEICEHVQQGLKSPSYHAGRYSVKQEQGLYAFHQYLRRIYSSIL